MSDFPMPARPEMPVSPALDEKGYCPLPPAPPESGEKRSAPGVYSGYTLETLSGSRLLSLADVLVDGPYIEKLRDPDLLFRGSSNQRLIDVQKSLYSGQTVLWNPDITIAI